MRAYRIVLNCTDGVSIGMANIQPDFQPPTQLILQQNMGNMHDNVNMEFEVLSYVNESGNSVYNTAVLSLYNVNRYWHNENSMKKLSKAHILVYAGTKASPLHYRQGLIDPINTCYAFNDTQILARPIYEGAVANAYAGMDGNDTVLTLNLIPNPETENNTPIPQIQIAGGADWRLEVKKFIENYLKLAGDYKTIVMIGKPNKDSLKLSQYDISTNNIAGIFNPKKKDGITLCSWVQKQFNEIIYKEDNIIWIGEALTSVGRITNISDRDLRGQPQLINPNTIALTLPLTNKFTFLQKINLSLESFISYNQAAPAQGDTAGISFTLKRTDKLYAGIYTITQIKHTCQSRNAGIDAWSTIIEAVKET